MLDLKNPISKTTDRVKKRGNVHKACLASVRTTNKDYQKNKNGVSNNFEPRQKN